MRETSYHAVIGEMTVRALWEMQNVMDCIPDELWDHCYGGAPLWQHLYHTLHHLDQWFINPRDNDFVEPPVHTPHLQELDIYPATNLSRRDMDGYFFAICPLFSSSWDIDKNICFICLTSYHYKQYII